MQQELFEMPFTCSIMESINWTPVVEKNIAYNLTITYEENNKNQSTILFPNFASYSNRYNGTPSVEFLVGIKESPALANFINNAMRKGIEEKKYCFIFYSNDKKYLVHDPSICSIKFEANPSNQDEDVKLRVEVLCEEIDIF